jgi:serine/threonine protein kinase
MDPAEAAVYLDQVFGGRYRTTDVRGTGQFSAVFRAIDETTGSNMAVKVLSGFSSDPVSTLEFEGELELLQSLTSAANVVDLLDFGEQIMDVHVTVTAGVSLPMQLKVRYLVLELADASLDAALAAGAKLTWLERCKTFRQVVRGVHQMHTSYCVHRDAKSDNTLLFSEGGETIAKVADLGRSRDCRKPARFALIAYDTGRGDYRFAPPELLWHLGHDDAISYMQVDLYHLGSILFELVTGFGITAFALGDFRPILSHASKLGSEAARRADYAARRGELRSRFDLAYAAFEAQIPPQLRPVLGPVLRQLTDPDPTRRLPLIPPGSRLPRAWDLQWLLRRIDVAIKVLEIEARGPLPKWVKSRR